MSDNVAYYSLYNILLYVYCKCCVCVLQFVYCVVSALIVVRGAGPFIVSVWAHFSVLPCLSFMNAFIHHCYPSLSLHTNTQICYMRTYIYENNDCIVCSMRQKYWMCFLNIFSLLPHLYTYIFALSFSFCSFHSFDRFDEFVVHFWSFLHGVLLRG